MKKITSPFNLEMFKDLKTGDQVLISGTIYTARDAAHLRLVTSLNNNEPLPFDLKNQIIYYVGPTPTKPGQAFGSAGPTTSYRMDKYTPDLIDNGLIGMIGKGKRSDEVKAYIKDKAVYFAAIGGIAALIGKCVINSEIIAYDDLGAEAIRKLEVVDLPVIVINDLDGNDLYIEGPKKYKEGLK